MGKYYGITIGPVCNTLSLSTKPAGLWCGSYLFSYLTRRLCEAFVRSGISPEDFLSPYVEAVYENGTVQVQQKIKGVGLYHDRIVFRADDRTMEEISDIADRVKRELSSKIAEAVQRVSDEEFIRTYLQIHIVCRELEDEVNPVLELAGYLDASELMYNFNQDYVSNPIVDLFDKDREDGRSAAELLKKSFLVQDCGGEWPLLEKDSSDIMSMKDIAGACAEKESFRQSQYCAIVKADGDYMTEVLKGLTDKEKPGTIRGFSGCCLEYEVKAAEAIKKYGAVNIYAGGDDLMFLAPLTGADGRSLFELLKTIRGIFEEAYRPYRTEPGYPTLSFGVVIHYYKFPLYEWVDEAEQALQSGAKSILGKDFLAVRWIKHSGKKGVLAFEKIDKSGLYDKFLELLNTVQQKDAVDAAEVFLSSIPQKIGIFRTLFRQALVCGKHSTEYFMRNTFDSSIHKKDEIERCLKRVLALIFAVREYALELSDEKLVKIRESLFEGRPKDRYALFEGRPKDRYDFMVQIILHMLQTARFWVERKGED